MHYLDKIGIIAHLPPFTPLEALERALGKTITTGSFPDRSSDRRKTVAQTLKEAALVVVSFGMHVALRRNVLQGKQHLVFAPTYRDESRSYTLYLATNTLLEPIVTVPALADDEGTSLSDNFTTS